METRLLENVGALPGFLPEDNQIMPYRKFSVDLDVDVESMCLCLQSLLGVKFKAISAVLASPESAVGGWLRKADLTAASEGWLRRMLTLARYKVESRMRREDKLTKLKEGIKKWQNDFEGIEGGCVVGVGGGFSADGKEIAVVGNFKVAKSLHLSLGGDGDGIVIYGKGLKEAHFNR